MSSCDFDAYFAYLRQRSPLGLLYRKLFLYPRLSRHLSGQALDFGCGIGDFLSFRSDTIGVDINPRCVEYCRQCGLKAEMIGDAPYPFPDSSFDSAVMDNVLEHIERPEPVLAELHRLIRPGGRLVVGVPGRLGFASDDDHKRFYDVALLDEVLIRASFEPERHFYTPTKSAWLDRHMRQYCLYGVFRRVAEP